MSFDDRRWVHMNGRWNGRPAVKKVFDDEDDDDEDDNARVRDGRIQG